MNVILVLIDVNILLMFVKFELISCTTVQYDASTHQALRKGFRLFTIGRLNNSYFLNIKFSILCTSDVHAHMNTIIKFLKESLQLEVFVLFNSFYISLVEIFIRQPSKKGLIAVWNKRYKFKIQFFVLHQLNLQELKVETP